MLCAVFGCGWKIGDTALHTTVYACHKANKQTKRESKKQSCCNIVLSLYYLKKLGVREGFSEVIFPHIQHHNCHHRVGTSEHCKSHVQTCRF